MLPRVLQNNKPKNDQENEWSLGFASSIFIFYSAMFKNRDIILLFVRSDERSIFSDLVLFLQ